jgi:hypothetical protein
MNSNVLPYFFRPAVFAIAGILCLGVLGWRELTHNPHRGGMCIDAIKQIASDRSGATLVCKTGEWHPAQ